MIDNPGTQVRLAQLRDIPLSLDEVLEAVSEPGVGGVCIFLGIVRDVDGFVSTGKAEIERVVIELDYSAHSSAESELHRACHEVASRHSGIALAVLHRVGTLTVGDIAVVVAAAARHRSEAFAGARDLIDTLKATVPIWKHQRFADGSTEWVGLP
ncbi:MAG: molybdenum cofactor biosynthesis protein MoaE [Actinomycetota bacterium]